MSESYNKTIIIGRLGHDPECRQTEKCELARFSISQNRIVDGKEDAQWHRVCAFGKQAAVVKKYLRKGDLCCIEGRLEVRAYEKNGEKRTAHSIIADKVTFLQPSRREKQLNAEGEVQLEDEALPY